MRLAVDLHIHSCLSPCSDSDMTPNNIINMSCLKGLDIIAITDHNTAENVSAILECSKDKNIIVIPGMEVETSEEIHVICLLPDVRKCFELQDIVYNALPNTKNRPEIFGEQIVMDKNDEIIGYNDRLLLRATLLSIDEIYEIVNNLNGVMIPAHVDRDSYSILSSLGMIPENLYFKYLEISKDCDLAELTKNNEFLKGYDFIKSSDAHYLENLLERECFIELNEKSEDALINELKGR